VVGHRLRPAGILGEHSGGDLQPCRQPVHEDIDRLIHLRQGHAGMPKQCQLHGKAKTVGNTAPRRHEVLVGSCEGVVPRQSIRITRHTKQQPALLIGQQLSAGHASLLPSRNRSS
jgi:hypothetical protein